jgi:hypothetical protein
MYIPISSTKQNNTSESSLVSYVLNMGWVMWILASSVPSFPYQNQQYPSPYLVKGTCWSQNQQYPAHYNLKVEEQPGELMEMLQNQPAAVSTKGVIWHPNWRTLQILAPIVPTSLP